MGCFFLSTVSDSFLKQQTFTNFRKLKDLKKKRGLYELEALHETRP